MNKINTSNNFNNSKNKALIFLITISLLNQPLVSKADEIKNNTSENVEDILKVEEKIETKSYNSIDEYINFINKLLEIKFSEFNKLDLDAFQNNFINNLKTDFFEDKNISEEEFLILFSSLDKDILKTLKINNFDEFKIFLTEQKSETIKEINIGDLEEKNKKEEIKKQEELLKIQKIEAEKNLIKETLLKLDYKNISKLDQSKLDEYFKLLKSAFDRKLIKKEDIIKKIIPDPTYATMLSFSDNFVLKELPARVKSKKMASRNDAYAKKSIEFNSYGKITRDYQLAHTNVFEAYIKYFGGNINFTKECNIFDSKTKARIPSLASLNSNHPDAIDLFCNTKTNGAEQIGPNAYAMSGGIVISSANDRKGGDTELSYISGGLSAKAGNGVIIYNSEHNDYYLYFHFFSTEVRPGDIIEAGDYIGKVGNTGINARKKGHGNHIHFEIHDVTNKGKNITFFAKELYNRIKKVLGIKPDLI